jgi:hypothetical protein
MRDSLGSSTNGSPTMTFPQPRQPIPIPSIKLRVASSLAWLAGSYTIVIAASMGFLEITGHHSLPLLFLVNGLLGLLLCLTGYLLRNRRKSGGILALVLSLLTGYSLVAAGRFMGVTFILTLAGFVLVLMSWGELTSRAAA